MENLSAIERLDIFLKYFEEQQEESSKERVIEHFQSNYSAVTEVIDHLVLDGFVKEAEYTMTYYKWHLLSV